MTLNANSIFKMSMTIRNLLRSSRHITSVRLLQNSCVRLISEKGTSKILEPQSIDFKEPQNIMKVRNQFKWCESKSQIFEIVNNTKDMTGNEAAGALEALFKFDRKDNQRPDESIKQRKEFIALCEIIKKDLSMLSSDRIIDVLKILMYFEIPTTSIIVQSLLQMIRQSMNTLSLEQITFIHYLLRKIKVKTPLTEALKIALPIVFQTHLNTKIDTENVNSLINALIYLQLNKDNESIQFILDALEKRSQFDLNQAINILVALYHSQNNSKNIKLIDRVQQIIAENVEQINPSRLEFIVSKMGFKVKQSAQYFYNEGLVESIVQTIISKNIDVVSALNILSALNKLRFASTSLLDYIAAKYYENKYLINDLNAHQRLNLLCAMSLADYKPIFWDSLKDVLLNNEILEVQYFMLIKAGVFLAALDCYWPKLLDRIFQNEYLTNEALVKQILRKDQRQLLLLHHAVSAFYPEYTGPLLSDNIIQILKRVPSPIVDNYELKSALEVSLGGPQYVKTQITTDFGYHIDHLVVMRKGGFPIAINDENEPPISKLSDIKLIPDSQVLLFLWAHESFYAWNTQRLTGIQLLAIRLIKSKSNYTVIPVIADMWKNFSELERTRYISQAIKLKSEKFSASVNS